MLLQMQKNHVNIARFVYSLDTYILMYFISKMLLNLNLLDTHQYYTYYSVYFRSITRSYYRNSVGVLIVFDITKRQSFENISGWLKEAKYHIEPHQAVYMLVGHKADCDTERQVSYREGSSFAQLNGLKYTETSARNGQNVEETFQTVAKDIYHLLEEGRVKLEEGWDGIKPGFRREPDNIHLEEEEPEKTKCCL